jgi:hypothetical protein
VSRHRTDADNAGPFGRVDAPEFDTRHIRLDASTLVCPNDTSANDHMTLPALPCFPCPYNASCCAYGVSLSDEEAAEIEANHGAGLVYKTRWGEYRTRIKKGRCAMYRDGGCSIHDKSYYPATCRGFPWTDSETGGPYEYDVTICGEFERRPELIQLQRAIPHPGRAPSSHT